MGYFGSKVGRPVGISKEPADISQPVANLNAAKPHFAAQVGKALAVANSAVADRCPRCNGALAEDDGYMRCGGRCGRRWVEGGPGRWLDPAVLTFGTCGCCRPRQALVAADVGAICPASHVEYLILPEGIKVRAKAAPFGICRCCLPPQPLVMAGTTLACRSKPQNLYQVVESGKNGGEQEVVWLGSAPKLDQAAVTAAIDAALSANSAELTLFGLFTTPTNQ